ncbi:MAG: class I SAM-dependent methyltransferase [Candidatus Dormibacteraeota bacterium]|nr:class I SAM-dependent methyltransferase [Candidatus Dormibacteraeota bacterium]MDQ6899391.1 class I SAM-dependent methyltransferase [Candidatus Dormibacteraeota bacterium]
MSIAPKSPPAASSGRADYGFDAPKVPIFLTLGGIAALCIAVVSVLLGWGVVETAWFGLVGVGTLACAAQYVHATRRGKHRAWAKILDSIAWRGDETVLDLGCGRGAVLIAAAQRIPRGRAVGVDIWDTADQSGNSIEVTRRNAELEGVADRVQLETADIRELPFDAAEFDAVLSSLVLHNVHSPDDRRRALEQAVRVLRPGGRLLVADIMHLTDYRSELERLGLEGVTVRELGSGTWFGNPFMRTRLVSGTKPAPA